MLYITHTVDRIIRTAGTDLRFIWTDAYEETHDPDWTGYFRGSIGGFGPEGEYQREDGTGWNNGMTVVEAFEGNGGVIEDYVAPVEPPAEEE